MFVEHVLNADVTLLRSFFVYLDYVVAVIPPWCPVAFGLVIFALIKKR